MNNSNSKNIKRLNFDWEYYSARYFMYNLNSYEEALDHWEKVGYRKKLLTSICDELKTHDHCLCICTIKDNTKQDSDTISHTSIIKAERIE